MSILEPEEQSHPLAIPPPAHALSWPRPCKRVVVCSDQADRPILARLGGCLGDQAVVSVPTNGLRTALPDADAILLPDPDPPTSVGSLGKLSELACNRIVVVSLPALAKLSRGSLSLRKVRQEDDPVCAKVVLGNHVTSGFALHDILPFGWYSQSDAVFVQNQFKKTAGMKAFCGKHAFVPVLTSMCNRDAASECPVCLQKDTGGGALYAMDIEPAEDEGSTMGEPVLPLHILLGMLGRRTGGLGQYAAPVRREEHLRETLREMQIRFPGFVVHDADVPTDRVTQQLVTIGQSDDTYGLPLRPKPAILVRSGLHSGDVESVYGCLMWFKQLMRMAPHGCPYAHALAARFRLAWEPMAAPWDARDGWERLRRPARHPVSLDIEGSSLAALIDVVSVPVNRARVVLARAGESFRAYRRRIPELQNAFGGPGFYLSGVADGDSFADRDRYTWRHTRRFVLVETDPTFLDETLYRDALAAGADVIRIEVPACDSDFTTHSIHRTDLTATLLEHAIGLQYGLIAVNRGTDPVQFGGFAPVEPGAAIIVDRTNPMLREDLTRAG